MTDPAVTSDSSAAIAPVTAPAPFAFWSGSLSLVGGVGVVIWAFNKKKKGKFWYFVLGSAVGGLIGYAIDKAHE